MNLRPLILAPPALVPFLSLLAAADEADDLKALFDAEWEHTMEISPDLGFVAAWVTAGGTIAGLDVSSGRARAREWAMAQQVLTQLAAIHRETLPPADRVNYDMFRRSYETAIESYRFGRQYIPLDQRGGIQTADELGDALRFETVKDYEDWIARLRGFGAYMDQTIAVMREGMRSGVWCSRR